MEVVRPSWELQIMCYSRIKQENEKDAKIHNIQGNRIEEAAKRMQRIWANYQGHCV